MFQQPLDTLCQGSDYSALVWTKTYVMDTFKGAICKNLNGRIYKNKHVFSTEREEMDVLCKCIVADIF